MKNIKKLVLSIIFLLLFFLLIYGTKSFDVKAIGPMSTSVGFATINGMFHELIGSNLIFYDITEYFGFMAIGVCATFGFVGLNQWIKRKNMFKVDLEILALGVLFIITIGVYVLFQFVIVNYRPIIMPDNTMPESSFPSSHTVLICVVMAATIMIIDKYVKADVARIIKIICIVLEIATVGLRFLSGVHWFTDVIGGLLISTSLLFMYSFVID